MELRYKAQFNRDIDIKDAHLLEAVHNAILNVKSAKALSRIHGLKKLRKYKTHYRIKIEGDYRIGVIIRGKTIWFSRFGHRSNFYKSFP